MLERKYKEIAHECRLAINKHYADIEIDIVHMLIKLAIFTNMPTRLARRPVFYGTSRIWRSLSRVPKRAVTGRYLSRISALLVKCFKTLDLLLYLIFKS